MTYICLLRPLNVMKIVYCSTNKSNLLFLAFLNSLLVLSVRNSKYPTIGTL
jgi:hypothetical protein